MNRIFPLFVVLGLAACGSNPTRPDPSPNLVTRPSEPLEPRPVRMGATRVEILEDVRAAIEQMLTAESDSNSVVVMTGLSWADGHQTVAVAHVRFPPEDMTEADYDAAVDEQALERCDVEFQDCVDGLDSCQEEAYESCIHAAYRNQFVYMSSHLGIDCGILELSMYTLDAGRPSLQDRRTLDPMVCDHDFAGAAPSAADVDGDGGPELVYTWSSTREASWADEEMRESIVIVDANDLHEQFRFHRDSEPNDYTEEERVTGLSTVDSDGDGLSDLQTSFVDTTGYCTGYGWALDSRFVVPDDATSEDEACHIDIQQTLHPYDPVNDVWTTDKPDTDKPDEGS